MLHLQNYVPLSKNDIQNNLNKSSLIDPKNLPFQCQVAILYFPFILIWTHYHYLLQVSAMCSLLDP